MGSEMCIRDSNLDGLSPPIVTLTSGFSRPPARPPPLWLLQLASVRRSRCSHRCRLVHCFQLVSYTNNSSTVFSASEKQVGHVWAVSRTYPIHLNCTDSRPRARWYQLRGLPLVGSECVCPQCNSSFVITRGSAKPSAFGLPVPLSRAH